MNKNLFKLDGTKRLIYCVEGDCDKTPSMNYSNEPKRRYCSLHAKEGMVTKAQKLCIFENCTIVANFNRDGENEKLYCLQHSKPESEKKITAKKGICIEENCKTYATFGFPGKSRIYCKTHKKEGCIDIKNLIKKCIECDKQATYNFIGEKKAIFCLLHKKDEMVNVKDKICIHPNCKILASFNYENNNTPLYCTSHKLPLMIDHKNKNKICLFENCDKYARYNFNGEKIGLYCIIHCNPLMVNVISKSCNNDWCSTRSNEKYNGYCAFCFRNMFPDHELTRNYKTKEKCVADFIKDNFPDKDWICDKRVKEGCSKRRPDLLLDLGYQVLIIEIDENQHIDYDTTCEKKRLNDIAEDLNFRPIIFIRFNPDQYDSNDNHIESCWKINSKGQCVIKNHTDWNNRLNILKENVEKWINPENQLNELIHIIQLFYDN